MKCTLCDFIGKTNSQLQNHMSIRHGGSAATNCRLCDFRISSNYQLEKHMKVRHESRTNISQQCRYWRRGHCSRGAQCNFKHESFQVCWYKLQDCPYWQNCKRYHQDTQPCKYQNYCQNSMCPYEHFLEVPKLSYPQPPPNNFQHFPPLNTVRNW